MLRMVRMVRLVRMTCLHPNARRSNASRGTLAAACGAAALWAAAGAAPGLVPRACASTARSASLGGVEDFTTDEGEVRRWFASLAEYSNLVIVESGSWDLEDGRQGPVRTGPGCGVHAAGDREGRWGTFALYLHARESGSDPGSLHAGDLKTAWTGIYARRCGPVQAGLRVRHVRDRLSAPLDASAGATQVSWLRLRRDVGLGARMDLGAAAFLDLAADLTGMTDDLQGEETLPSRPAAADRPVWRSFAFRARTFVRTGPRTALVPRLEYVLEDYTEIGPWEDSGLTLSTDRRAWLWRGGAGWTFFPDVDKLLLLSAEYLRSATAPRTWNGDVVLDLDRELRLWSWRAAGEARLGPWVTVRAGAVLERRTDRDGTWSDARWHLPLSVGLGLSAGSLVLDVALCDRQPGGTTRLFADAGLPQAGTWVMGTVRYGFGP